MNDCGAIKVMKQAKIPLKIGVYTGEVLCDVTPMTACHVLLGRPWLSDNHVKYDGKYNKIRLNSEGQRVVIPALPPHKVHSDQIELKKRFRQYTREQKALVSSEQTKPLDATS